MTSFWNFPSIHTVPFKSKLTVCCESRFSTRFAILDSCANRESRIENKLSRIKSRIESHRTENKRFTHDWFLDNFTRTYSCNTTLHGYIRRSDCMLETRPIQVIKQMFLQGHLYQASFPQLKFQIPAPNANKWCNTCVQATSCLFCNVKWFWAYPAAWLDKRSAVTYTSVRNMGNLLLRNCVRDPWKLSRNNGFNSTKFNYWTGSFCFLNDAKCCSNKLKVSTQNITQSVRTNANFLKSCPERFVNCYLHSSGISHKNQTLSRICYFIENKDFSDVREVRRLLKTWTKVVTCRFSQQSSIESRERITRY